MNEPINSYEERMIDIAQLDSNKRHCMDYTIDLAEEADIEIRKLKLKIRSLGNALCWMEDFLAPMADMSNVMFYGFATMDRAKMMILRSRQERAGAGEE